MGNELVAGGAPPSRDATRTGDILIIITYEVRIMAGQCRLASQVAYYGDPLRYGCDDSIICRVLQELDHPEAERSPGRAAIGHANDNACPLSPSSSMSLANKKCVRGRRGGSFVQLAGDKAGPSPVPLKPNFRIGLRQVLY